MVLTVADPRFLARVHARAARETEGRAGRPQILVPPGPPVPEMLSPEPAPVDPGPPVASGPRLTQKERTRALHDDLAEVVNHHGASPETVLMALELLKHQVLAPRLQQMELE
ncbi:MAG: hypothetical protein HMLKMBBP_00105 [Planctomycetes bacterium]|nr:hypothetical protein [Planctomycetota bacterium]